jgi:hypothetical protein
LGRWQGQDHHRCRPGVWVSGTNGENRIEARAATQGEAWLQAVEQGRTLGMPDGGRRLFA